MAPHGDSPVPVPAAPDELTTAWFRRALGRDDLELAGRERIGAEHGLASTTFRCRLAGAGAPPSLVAKLWSTEPPAGRAEAAFYVAFGPRAGIRVPACSLASIDDVRGRGILLLEDFPGATQGDCLEDLDRAAAESMARRLAAFHATWWGSAELTAGWLPARQELVRDAAWFARKRPRFRERFGADVPPAIQALVDRLEQVLALSNAILRDAPPTLVHGDLHLDNVLFPADGGEPVLLDWAGVGRGPAAIDLGELVFAMTATAHLEPTLAAYVGELRRRGVDRDERALRRDLDGALLRKIVRETAGISDWAPASAREARILGRVRERLAAAVEAWPARSSTWESP